MSDREQWREKLLALRRRQDEERVDAAPLEKAVEELLIGSGTFARVDPATRRAMDAMRECGLTISIEELAQFGGRLAEAAGRK